MIFNSVFLKDIVINLDSKRKPLNETERKALKKKNIYPYCGANGILDYIDEYIFDQEILCLAEDGGSWGFNEKCCYIMNEPCWVNNHAHVLAPKSNVNIKYLYYYLNYMDLTKYITGTTRGKLTKSALEKIKVQLPSLNNQKKIVNILDKAQELIDKRKAQIEALDQLAQSVFLEMFGDPVINSNNFKTIPLEDLCMKISGGGTPPKSKPEYYIGEIPWVTPKDMKKILIDDSLDHISTDAIKNSSAKIIPQNSLLMVIRSGILKKKLPVAINTREVTINQDMKAFTVNKELVNPEYLLYFFIFYQRKLLSKVRAVTADNIDFNQIKKIPVPIPIIEHQNQFSEIFYEINKRKNKFQEQLALLQNLFNSLMQRAFKGELFAAE